ncbi:MAG: hypothetical protein ACTS73_09970 [Arsenophonus sp. NEOnobi-MAG3]
MHIYDQQLNQHLPVHVSITSGALDIKGYIT